METVVLAAAFGIAVLCGALLLFWIVSALRGKRSGMGRIVATIVVMCAAVWQVYIMRPAVATNLIYFLAPTAGTSLLLILYWMVLDLLREPPPERPGVKIPAMALRLPADLPQELEEEEQKIAVGQ